MSDIDWTKPLELMDGTPVVLENPETSEVLITNPDAGGDYWIHHVDGETEITMGYQTYRYRCVSPDGDNIKHLRNRKEPTA